MACAGYSAQVGCMKASAVSAVLLLWLHVYIKFVFCFGPHPNVLEAYSQLGDQSLFLAVLRVPYTAGDYNRVSAH